MTDSPCVKVCSLDESGRLCLGCFRTIDEIGLWGRLSDAERARVVAMLAGRRLRHESARAAMAAAPSWAPSTCERCGAPFACGAADRSRPCWCMSYPPVPAGGGRCLCPACLETARA